MTSPSSNRTGLLANGVAFLMGVLVCGGIWIAWSLWNPANTDSDRYPDDPIATLNSTESGEIERLASATSDFDGTTVATFDEIVRNESGYSRNLALYNFVMDLDEVQLLELINRTNDVPRKYRSESQKVIVERLYEINPEFALDHVDKLQTSFVPFLFHQWAKNDVADAIARAKSLEGTVRRAALEAILAHGSQVSADQREEIEHELGTKEQSTGLSVRQGYSEIQGDPEKGWNKALREGTYDSDHIQTLVISGLLWIRQNGFEVIDEISAGLENVQVREQVLASVLISASQFVDMEDIFRKALELENDPDQLLLSDIVGYWSAKDPKSAFDATKEVESYSRRNRLQRALLHTWAYKEPRAVLDELDGIPQNLQSMARSDALEAIAQSDPREAILLVQDLNTSGNKTNLLTKITATWAEQDPQAALAWVMNNSEFEGGRTRLLSNVVTGWSKRDPNAALNWLLEQTEYAAVRKSALVTILKNLADRNPELALRRALEQPTEEDQIGLEQTVIRQIAQNDLQLAREMLHQTREGITRLNSYATVGIAMVRASRGNEAVELASDLRDHDREKYLASILWNWVDFDAKGLHDSLSTISDPEIRASAAGALIVSDNANDILTNEQKKTAGEQLGERDASNVAPKLQTIRR